MPVLALGGRGSPTTGRLLSSQLEMVGCTLTSAAGAAGLGGIAGFNEAIPFKTARLSVKASVVTFKTLGKNRHIRVSG